jgi:hypothetical protein
MRRRRRRRRILSGDWREVDLCSVMTSHRNPLLNFSDYPEELGSSFRCLNITTM